jgi:hypothetical protein
MKKRNKEIYLNIRDTDVYKELVNEMRKYRCISDRVEFLESRGYEIIENIPFGSGGVGNLKIYKKRFGGVVLLQVSSGKGTYNYAKGIIFQKLDNK